MSFERRSFSRPSSAADNKEMIFGIRPVMEAINAGKEIDKILVQKDENSTLVKELLQLAHQHKIPVSKVPVEKLNTFTRKVHQGVVAFFSAISYASLDNIIDSVFEKGKSPFILVLDRITDVRNFGGIARTAECSGVDAIVIPLKGAAQINSDAMKTSAGALNYIPVCREESLFKTIQYLKNSGLQIVACTEKAEKNVSSFDFTGPCAVIMGSEEDGISNDILVKADALVKIPMQGKIESMNVSVATGIILYEAVRQRTE